MVRCTRFAQTTIDMSSDVDRHSELLLRPAAIDVQHEQGVSVLASTASLGFQRNELSLVFVVVRSDACHIRSSTAG